MSTFRAINYQDPSFICRLYNFGCALIFHPIRSFECIWFWGIKDTLSQILFGGLLPPPLKYFAVAKGFPRKHTATTTADIEV